jgi:hypothetical protein
MKFTFIVNQSAVVEAGLLGKVTGDDLCLLHYLRGWFNFGRAKIQVVEGRKFVWLHYERAIEDNQNRAASFFSAHRLGRQRNATA